VPLIGYGHALTRAMMRISFGLFSKPESESNSMVRWWADEIEQDLLLQYRNEMTQEAIVAGSIHATFAFTKSIPQRLEMDHD
jgi:hypothetical protein